MDVDLSLDEIIKRNRGFSHSENKKIKGLRKTRKLINTTAFKTTKSPVLQSQTSLPIKSLKTSLMPTTYDARNKIIKKARAKITDARHILNKNMRQHGVDARHLLLERKLQRQQPSVAIHPETVMAVNKRTGPKDSSEQHHINMTNRPSNHIKAIWNEKESALTIQSRQSIHSPFSRYNQTRFQTSFGPRGYVDHDNMQELEEEEFSRSLHMGGYKNPTAEGCGRFYNRAQPYGINDEDIISANPILKKIHNQPYTIYDTSSIHVNRPTLPPSPLIGHSATGDNLFERRQRSMVSSSNLSESLRARLFGSEPDRGISHGIYANENGGLGKLLSTNEISLHSRRTPPPLSAANHKTGYRLLVSNLHSNVTTADIRELFSDIGPMYGAHVVRPGTAEIIYKTLKHAELAVDTYHQREFDGQPMHCVLINPHSTNRPIISLANSRTVTTNSSGVEVDIDALHSVLFRDR